MTDSEGLLSITEIAADMGITYSAVTKRIERRGIAHAGTRNEVYNEVKLYTHEQVTEIKDGLREELA